MYLYLYFCCFVERKKKIKIKKKQTKREITHRFSKTLENSYEGVQFSGVADLQPATLQNINSFIDMKQGFQSRIHKNLPHSFNLFDKCSSCSYSSWITQLIKSI